MMMMTLVLPMRMRMRMMMMMMIMTVMLMMMMMLMSRGWSGLLLKGLRSRHASGQSGISASVTAPTPRSSRKRLRKHSKTHRCFIVLFIERDLLELTRFPKDKLRPAI